MAKNQEQTFLGFYEKMCGNICIMLSVTGLIQSFSLIICAWDHVSYS